MLRPYNKAEPVWVRDLFTECKKYGLMFRGLHGGIYGGNGWPDKLIVGPGFTILVEFKGPKTPIKPLQKTVHVHLNKQNPGCCYFIRREEATSGGRIFRINPYTGVEEYLGVFIDKKAFPKMLIGLFGKGLDGPKEPSIASPKDESQ